MRKKIFRDLICAGLVFGSMITGMPQAVVYASSATEPAIMAEAAVGTSEIPEGDKLDLTINNFKFTGGKAGETATVSFTATTNPLNDTDTSKIANIKKVFANIDDSSPFETDDEASRITYVDATTVNISYTFKVKDNVESTYYSVPFSIVYEKNEQDYDTDEEGNIKRDTNGNKCKKAAELHKYVINKNFSIKLTAKPEEKKPAEAESADTDVAITVKNAPKGTYGEKCTVAFTVESKIGKIVNVAPVISDSFPFETKGDAYKNITSKGSDSVKCSYTFQVRSDVATGYSGVTFAITYKKGDKTFTANKNINVKLEGKPEKKDETPKEEGKTSTPRLMVSGCDINLDQIFPNDVFTLTVHLKNTAKKTVSNIKVTLASEEKNFISTNGASSAYVESVPAGGTADVTFELQADSSLSAKAYGLNVKTEYEDQKANPFTSEDSLTIPVSLKASLKLADIQVPYDVMVGTDGTISFTITNTGSATLNNVNVSCESEDFSCEESFVGTIAAGASGYATINITGVKATEGEGLCNLIVTYEDNKGNQTEYSEPTNIFVSEYVDMEEDVNYDDMPVEEAGPTIWPYIVGTVVIIVVIVLLVLRAKKKRKKAEEELMDDDI